MYLYRTNKAHVIQVKKKSYKHLRNLYQLKLRNKSHTGIPPHELSIAISDLGVT